MTHEVDGDCWMCPYYVLTHSKISDQDPHVVALCGLSHQIDGGINCSPLFGTLGYRYLKHSWRP